jgi:hypothetical protein
VPHLGIQSQEDDKGSLCSFPPQEPGSALDLTHTLESLVHTQAPVPTISKVPTPLHSFQIFKLQAHCPVPLQTTPQMHNGATQLQHLGAPGFCVLSSQLSLYKDPPNPTNSLYLQSCSPSACQLGSQMFQNLPPPSAVTPTQALGPSRPQETGLTTFPEVHYSWSLLLPVQLHYLACMCLCEGMCTHVCACT